MPSLWNPMCARHYGVRGKVRRFFYDPTHDRLFLVPLFLVRRVCGWCDIGESGDGHAK